MSREPGCFQEGIEQSESTIKYRRICFSSKSAEKFPQGIIGGVQVICGKIGRWQVGKLRR
ncbi:MAG TPA: hypothetical protein DCR20_13205 [Planctomycetaceae bacterium]|nr:hypothetical protein [Planctomycetaceae bacterium]